MPRRESYVPKHRGPLPDRPRTRGARRPVLLSGAALLATGLAVSSGIALESGNSGGSASAALASTQVRDHSGPRGRVDLGDRTEPVSRSDRRSSVDSTKAAALDQRSGGQVTQTEDLTTRDPRTVARALLAQAGFGADQFSCLDSLYNRESGWNVHADNPSSSAYGIPQSLPGSKMASAGPNWQDDAATQIKWGLGYIESRYGTPCGAWGHSQSNGWY